MPNYSHDKVVPFKDSRLGKKQQIAEMFDQIAFRYDLLNRFLSGGIDMHWRRRAIKELRTLREPVRGTETETVSGRGAETGGSAGERPAMANEAMVKSRADAATQSARNILDVATGTGDMAILMTRLLPGVRVTGIDISTGMLEIGREKVDRLGLGQQITLQPGDSEALEFPDARFDAITVAFGVRNFEDLEKGLKEMLRVLRPGGKLVILEFSQPRMSGVRQLYDLYLRLVAPRIGKMVSRNLAAYQYLNDSVKAFPEGAAFLSILERCGYAYSRLRSMSLGICSLYIAEKETVAVAEKETTALPQKETVAAAEKSTA